MIKREWDKFVKRAVWSWEGWLFCWRHEASLQQWVWANVFSGGFAIFLDITVAERALIISLGILILAAELMNTGIEKAVDHISTEEHPLAKIAKDTASGAVAITAIAAGVAWLVILIG
ncbi:MAG: diacylglycerol kinase [Rhodobacteraceae bacterium]|nr:diacylglycerol kinase [Paracoccaceae bacterium]